MPDTLVRIIVPLYLPDGLVSGLHAKLPNYRMLAMNPTDARAECPIDDGLYDVVNADGVMAARPKNRITLEPMTTLVLVNLDDIPESLPLSVREDSGYPAFDMPSKESLSEWRAHLDAKYAEHEGEYLTDKGE